MGGRIRLLVFGTKESVNCYVLHRTDRHPRPVTAMIASTHYLNKMKTDGRFNMPVETVRLIFMMAFGEPQDLKWVSVSVGFRVNYFCRSKVFRSPSVCLSSAVHLWYIIFDLDKYRSAKFLLAIASNALLVHFCPLFHSA